VHVQHMPSNAWRSYAGLHAPEAPTPARMLPMLRMHRPHVQACAGLAYSFSLYAPAVKERLGLSQVEIATVGSAVNLGGYFAILSGAIYDATKDHPMLGPKWVAGLIGWGGGVCSGGAGCKVAAAWRCRLSGAGRERPADRQQTLHMHAICRLVIAIGCLCNLCGYCGMWLMVSGRAPGGLPELLLFAICAGEGRPVLAVGICGSHITTSGMALSTQSYLKQQATPAPGLTRPPL
jgi:hypothetical protein